jgi:hypothetical protein
MEITIIMSTEKVDVWLKSSCVAGFWLVNGDMGHFPVLCFSPAPSIHQTTPSMENMDK